MEQEYRCQGIGSMLVKKIVNIFKQENVTYIVLAVRHNSNAIRLYEKLGFLCWHALIGKYTNGDRKLIFRLYPNSNHPDAQILAKNSQPMFCKKCSYKFKSESDTFCP